MMKKWALTIFIGALMTTTTACGSGESGKLESKEKQTKEGKTIVSLSLLKSSPFYETLEKKFEAKYSDIDLQIKAFKNIGEHISATDYEKYQKTTNTAILAGKSMDIIKTEGLPIKKYVNKKVLLDMNDLMKKDTTLNKSDLQMNVLEALKMNGALYKVPSGFFVSAFVGDGDILKNSSEKVDDKNWTWNEFEKVTKEVIQQAQKGSSKKQLYALANIPPEAFLQDMAVDNYTEFVDSTAKKAKFDSPTFVELMQQIKKMYDEKIMTSEPAEMDSQLFYSTMMTSPTDFIHGLYGPYSIFKNPELLQKPHTGQIGGMGIEPSSEFAIHANSPVKEEAWKFITFLLSDEAQSLQERAGFSLLTSVNNRKFEEIQENVKSGAFKLSDGKSVKVSDEAFIQFKQLVHNADQYAELDGKVLSIIGEEALSFFSGQKSAEEVAKLIQNRTTIYLNE